MASKLSILILGFTQKLGGGGGNIHFTNLIRAWMLIGNKVTIYDPLNISEFNLKSVLRATMKSLFLKIDSIDEMNDCDIIISESLYPPDIILAIRLSHKHKKPVAIYFHHITPAISIYPFRRGILRVFLNVIYTSILLHFVKNFEIPIFLDNPNTLDRHEMLVFPNLIAVRSIELECLPLPINLGMDYDICYIGRIENHKGLEDIIKVSRILVNKYSISLKVIIAGKGKPKYVEKIKKMIDRFRLTENVKIRGYVSEKEKYELLRRSRIFLFLSYEEGWAISVMEAAKMGIPIVAYSLPAYYYLKGNYFSVELGNIQQCAETIKSVLQENASALITAMKAKECSNVFSYEFIAKQQIIFFKKIIDDYGDNFYG